MSQKLPADAPRQLFSAGRGLLAAAETLNYSMKEQRPGGGEGPDPSRPPPRSRGNLGSTMKLFASLGLSPSDLDALAQIPEDEISVETLPRILLQLKSRKAAAGGGGQRRQGGGRRQHQLGRWPP
ncbi:LOW QUALITY PROTEIN: matrin-3-like [Menidia menidia]